MRMHDMYAWCVCKRRAPAGGGRVEVGLVHRGRRSWLDWLLVAASAAADARMLQPTLDHCANDLPLLERRRHRGAGKMAFWGWMGNAGSMTADFMGVQSPRWM